MTTSIHDLIRRLTGPDVPDREQRRSLNRFVKDLGWRPSDRVDGFGTREFAPVHLVVEHGLQNSAVISFLNRPYSRLGIRDTQALLSLSYNNLVDWHISVDTAHATFLFNRTDPPYIVERIDLLGGRSDALRAEMFEQMVGRRPTPNLPALDDALIRTISRWKRLLVADLEGAPVTNEDLSSLFNAIIFTRAIEDHSRRMGSADGRQHLLQGVWDAPGRPLRDHVQGVLDELTGGKVPPFLFDRESLARFDALDSATTEALFRDFYDNRYAQFYTYDFAVMSKHALSRVYEHYVSLLRFRESDQESLFRELPEEHLRRQAGSIYTPEFVARFFARVLRDNIPPKRFRQLRSIDPACGSGIFLRTVVETQCDPFTEFPADIREQVGRTVGIDVDENAAQAARLSIALLHLVMTDGELPADLPITASDAFEWMTQHPEEADAFDAVIANPPFVAIENQPEEVRDRIREFLGDLAIGRTDTYLAFLELAIRLLRPGGYGLFVVPHSFLISEAAQPVRERLAREAYLLYLVDLSGVQVFDHVDAYVVLLVFQKRSGFVEEPGVTLVRAKELVGNALQDALEGREVEATYYTIERSSQDRFRNGTWVLTAPSEATLRRRLEAGPLLSELFDVRLGFITGADDVFTMKRGMVPKSEKQLFQPYLRDRDMLPWRLPTSVGWRVFYPYVEGELLDEERLRERYPKTFAYLSGHRKTLEGRSAVKKGALPWWRPERPRPPERMMVPKVLTPHLVITPRFSLDAQGSLAVSHAPMIMVKRMEQELPEADLLTLLLGLLNSSACFWHVTHTSHKYQSSYSMLEPKTLRRTPLPNLDEIDPLELQRFIDLVEQRREEVNEYRAVERKIDEMVADFYRLGTRERRLLGLSED